MEIPREPVQLIRRDGNTRLLGTKSGNDWTSRTESWSVRRVHELDALDLCSYVLEKDSPSCGRKAAASSPERSWRRSSIARTAAGT